MHLIVLINGILMCQYRASLRKSGYSIGPLRRKCFSAGKKNQKYKPIHQVAHNIYTAEHREKSDSVHLSGFHIHICGLFTLAECSMITSIQIIFGPTNQTVWAKQQLNKKDTMNDWDLKRRDLLLISDSIHPRSFPGGTWNMVIKLCNRVVLNRANIQRPWSITSIKPGCLLYSQSKPSCN